MGKCRLAVSKRPLKFWTILTAFGLFCLLGCASVKQAQPKDPTWRCYSDFNRKHWAFTLQYRILNTGEKVGNVWVADTRHVAKYSVEGLYRRWDFDNGKYAITLSSEGYAQYYNFAVDADSTGKAKARHNYYCKRK